MAIQISRDLFEQAMYDADLDVGEALREKYNGRGMYGRTAVGIIGSLADYGKFLVAMTALGGEEHAAVLAANVSTDTMGVRSSIFYWGTLTLTDDPWEPEGEE
jgi:hypothetical protein